MIEKRMYLALLFDFYGNLLTEKQRIFFELYYDNDLSLGEIAEEYQVSRQAVYDNIKRVEIILSDYEHKLKMVSKYQSNQEKLQQALKIVDSVEVGQKNDVTKLRQLLEAMLKDGS